MAINLRLPSELEKALRDESERSGRSQHEIIRRALGDYLERPAASVERGRLKPPRRPYERPEHLLKLPEGVSSLDLLDREDRI